MSGTDKDTREYRAMLAARYGYPYRRDNGPGWWRAHERRVERRRATASLQRGESPETYRRPWYW